MNALKSDTIITKRSAISSKPLSWLYFYLDFTKVMNKFCMFILFLYNRKYGRDKKNNLIN